MNHVLSLLLMVVFLLSGCFDSSKEMSVSEQSHDASKKMQTGAKAKVCSNGDIYKRIAEFDQSHIRFEESSDENGICFVRATNDSGQVLTYRSNGYVGDIHFVLVKYSNDGYEFQGRHIKYLQEVWYFDHEGKAAVAENSAHIEFLILKPDILREKMQSFILKGEGYKEVSDEGMKMVSINGYDKKGLLNYERFISSSLFYWWQDHHFP